MLFIGLERIRRYCDAVSSGLVSIDLCSGLHVTVVIYKERAKSVGSDHISGPFVRLLLKLSFIID